MKIVAVILTLNEELHLERCIKSAKSIGAEVVVVDCFSTDATIEIAQNSGASVIQREWITHAIQFNWALTQLDSDTDWVLRLDADEYLTAELEAEIRARLPLLDPKIDGVTVGRRMSFLGHEIKHGGLFPIEVLRLFRYGKGQCELRWMDEHIKVPGDTVSFHGELIDDNLNTLTWWTDKHNRYASREAVDLLNLRYHFLHHDSVASIVGSQAGKKRWMKEHVYSQLPGGFRAFLYFFYRYFLRLGFLDGRAGTTFHFLQGFWYRYLVDAKVAEVEEYMTASGVGPAQAIERVLGIKVASADNTAPRSTT